MSKVIAMIPARMGSKRIPKKNIRLLNGKPLIQYAIDAVKDADCFDEIWINSESEVIEELDAANISNYELILVANYHAGTLDRTPEIVTTLAESNTKLVPIVYEKKKRMMGWDVCTGLAAAKGDSVALIDGDGQMPPRDIIRLYKVLQSGEFDFVKTYRTKRLDGFCRKHRTKII